MSRTCAVDGCGRGDYQLECLKGKYCNVHKVQEGDCGYYLSNPEWFTLHKFPTVLKNNEKRQIWLKMINRAPLDNSPSFWTPGKQSRVCSKHFETGCDYPLLNLGYPEDSARRRLEKLLPVTPGSKRKSKYRKQYTSDTGPLNSSMILSSTADPFDPSVIPSSTAETFHPSVIPSSTAST